MEPSDLVRSLAVRAATAGGRVISGASTGRVHQKGSGDYVTDADRDAERTIAAVLKEGLPGVPVVAEESGGEPADRYWLVDPLDGTTNFVHGFPVVAVSVALIEDGLPVAGAVHAPFLSHTWSAGRGAGADRDGRVIRVSDRAPEAAIVGTGFPFRSKHRLPEYRRVFDRALDRFEDLRRPGAVALDLAWTAEGTFDGFFELGLSGWDVAAGALLIQEAGGAITGWSGGDDYLAGDILAGNLTVHRTLLELAGG